MHKGNEHTLELYYKLTNLIDPKEAMSLIIKPHLIQLVLTLFIV